MSNRPEYEREFSEESYGETIDSLNTVLGNGLLLGSNLGGQIIENITLPVGENVAISHNLKMTPKYRIILRQIGGLVITDGDLEWDDKKIYLKAVSTSSGSAGTFTNGIGLRARDGGSTPSMGANDSNVGDYTLSGSTIALASISKATLNGAFSGGAITAVTEATVTIIIMRG